MKKILLIFIISILAIGLFAQKKSIRNLYLPRDEFSIRYYGSLADTVSSNDTIFTLEISIDANTASSLFYDIGTKIRKVSGTGSYLIQIDGKKLSTDSWDSLSSAQRYGATTDTVISFSENSNSKTYNYYRIRIYILSGTIKIYPYFIEGYLKRTYANLFFLRNDSNETANPVTLSYVTKKLPLVDQTFSNDSLPFDRIYTHFSQYTTTGNITLKFKVNNRISGSQVKIIIKSGNASHTFSAGTATCWGGSYDQTLNALNKITAEWDGTQYGYWISQVH